jgi:hypothetical protein
VPGAAVGNRPSLSGRETQRARIAHELIESLEGGGGDERARKVEAIRAALVEGEQSGIAEDSSIEGILSELREHANDQDLAVRGHSVEDGMLANQRAKVRGDLAKGPT